MPHRIVLSNYPDPDNGQAVSNLDSSLATVWVYVPEVSGTTFNDLNLQGFIADRTKVVVQSVEPGTGKAWWLVSPDGTGRTRETDTLSNSSGFQDMFAFRYIGPTDKFRLLYHEQTTPMWLYADAAILSDAAATGHGTRVSRTADAPSEMWSDPGVIGSAALLINGADFPAYDAATYPVFSGFTAYYPVISPDGSQIAFIHPAAQVPSTWQLEPSGAVAGGTFTLTVGTIGNIATDFYTTAPIAYTATAHNIWDALIALPNVVDPDPTSPYPRYSGSGTIQTSFLSVQLGPTNLWMTSDDSGISGGGNITADHLSNVDNAAGGYRIWLCNRDGSGLVPVPLSTNLNVLALVWNPDGSSVYYLGEGSDGKPYGRLYRANAVTGVSTLVLDYTGEGATPDSGPLENLPKFSPSGGKMVFIIRNSPLDHRELHIANSDGSGDTILFNQNYAEADATQDQLVISRDNDIAWSWDESTLCVIDGRNATPVFLVDTTTGVATKIFDGLGWTDSSLYQYLNTPLSFDVTPPVPSGGLYLPPRTLN